MILLQFEQLEAACIPSTQQASWGRWLSSVTEQVREEDLGDYQRETFSVAIRYVRPGSGLLPPPAGPHQLQPPPQQPQPPQQQQLPTFSLDPPSASQFYVSPQGQQQQFPQQGQAGSFLTLLGGVNQQHPQQPHQRRPSGPTLPVPQVHHLHLT